MLYIYNFLTNRIFLLSLVVVGLFYVLVAELFDLQIIRGDELSEEFNLKVIREVESKGQRGNIYDRFGVPLAVNVMAYNVYLNDSYEVADKNAMIHALVNAINSNGDEVINAFPIKYNGWTMSFIGSELDVNQFKKSAFNHRYTSQITDEEAEMSAFEVFEYLRDDLFEIDANVYKTDEIIKILNVRFAQYVKRYSKYQPEVIATNISERTLAELEEKKDIFPGVSIVESPFRQYNDPEYFAHIIGYTRDINAEKLELMAPLGYGSDDQVGFTGIEKELEPYLRGYDGTQKVEVNNLGKTMMVLEETAPIMGNDIYLTIDHDLQIETYHILEQQMAQILVDKLYMNYPKIDDHRYVLLKDVFDSVFRYELIDIDFLDESESVAGERISEKMNTLKVELVDSATEEILTNSTPKNLYKNHPIYYFILDQLEADGYLETSFYRNDYYELFAEKRISFNQLMQALFEEELLPYPLNDGEVIMAYLPDLNEDGKRPVVTDFEVDITLTEHIQRYVLNDVLTLRSLDKFLYLYAIDKEKFTYNDLTTLIIDVGLVSATEEQIELLSRNRLRPIDFMKEKILNIEITPQALALDPSSGSVVITDVDTGEVLALVSYPTYDNSRLVNEFDGAYYTELTNDITGPLFPRATLSPTVPGSTLKMLIGLAALEEGIIQPRTTVRATGYFNKIFPAAVCWIYSSSHGSHGSINVTQAIEQSCNYFFYEMGYRLGITETGSYNSLQGISTIQDYLARVGLDAKTGLEIGEANSSLPQLDPVRASIGQEQNNFTPVQLARYMNVLANDGEMRELNLVDKVLNKDGDVIEDFTPKVLRENTFEQEHLDAIKKGMLNVTEGSRGTARSYFADIDLQIAGKTGTAEIVTYNTKSIDPVRSILKRANHAVFTGFAPFDDPEISVVSVIQFGYSSKYAALNSKEVFRNYFDLERTLDTFDVEHRLE